MNRKRNKEQWKNSFPAKAIEPVSSLLNHLSIVFVITTLGVIMGITFIFLKIKPTFEAKAMIKIEPVVPKILYGKEEASIASYYDDFVNTQINIAKSFPVLSKAINDYDTKYPALESGTNDKEETPKILAWRLSDETLDQSVARLILNLKIVQMRDTQLFSITLTSAQKEGVAELTNILAETYLEAGRDEKLNKDKSRLVFLETRRQDTEEVLKNKYGILEKISSKFAVGITDEKNTYVYLQAIVDLTGQLIKTRTRRIEMETTLNELRHQMEAIETLDLSGDLNEWVEKDPAIKDSRIQLSRKRQEIRLKLAGLKASHPDRNSLKENLTKLLKAEELLRIESKGLGEKVLRGKLRSDQRKKVLEFETKFSAASNAEEKLHTELSKAEQKATDVNTQMMKVSTLRNDIKRLQDALLRIDERIDQIEVESRSPGRIRLMTSARRPEKPTGGKRFKLVLLVFVGSGVGGLLFAIGKDKLNDRITTTQDIERILGFPATGHVTDAGESPERLGDLRRIVTNHPFSRLSEEYKQIAFALSLEAETHHSKIYTCFSVGSGQGSTCLAMNTLAAFRAREEKKLLIDLNIWRPLHNTGLSASSQGLRDVIEGSAQIQDVILKENSYPFHLLPYGQWQKNKKNVFQEIGLEKIIEDLRDQYDVIMIDAPPFSLTTDARFLARLADVSILVLKAEAVKEKELFRVVTLLDKSEIEVISIVLNQVKLFKGKYYRSAMQKHYELVSRSIPKEPIS